MIEFLKQTSQKLEKALSSKDKDMVIADVIMDIQSEIKDFSKANICLLVGEEGSTRVEMGGSFSGKDIINMFGCLSKAILSVIDEIEKEASREISNICFASVIKEIIINKHMKEIKNIFEGEE